MNEGLDGSWRKSVRSHLFLGFYVDKIATHSMTIAADQNNNLRTYLIKKVEKNYRELHRVSINSLQKSPFLDYFRFFSQKSSTTLS